MTITTLDLPAARQLRDGLATLLRAERTAAADFLLALADFDRRRGWEPLGHASLFAFLRAELRLSSGAAFWRVSAARLLQRFPDLIEPLRDGRLCLSTTAELAKVLTDENRAEVLPRFFGLSAREAKKVTAELMPRAVPPLKAVVTQVERKADGQRSAGSVEAPTPAPESEQLPALAAPLAFRTSETAPNAQVRIPDRRDQVEPLTADLRRLHITVDRQFLKQLDAARDGLSHSIPGATTEQVLKAALDLLVEKQARARGQVKRPRQAVAAASSTPSTPTPTGISTSTATPTGTSTSTSTGISSAATTATEPLHRRAGRREHIPASIRRAVWARDQDRCVWPLDGGGVCGSTHRLEIDHRLPHALGGQPELGNLRLLCERHNKLAARLAFGARWMGRYEQSASPDASSTA